MKPGILAALLLSLAANAEEKQSDPFHLDPVEPLFGRLMKAKPQEGAAYVATIVENPPEELKKSKEDKAIRVYQADLDGDEKPDYIVKKIFASTSAAESAPMPEVCFYTSSLKLKSCDNKNFTNDGFQYIYFFRGTNSKGQPRTYFFSLAGFDDSNDFAVFELGSANWKPKRLFPFKAYIPTKHEGKDALAWGYAWDVTGLKKGSSPKLVKSAWPKDKKDCVPMVFFHGKPTQGASVEKYEAFARAKSVSLDELALEFQAKRKQQKDCAQVDKF